MTITVHDFEKRGEGIGSYVVYKVVTTVSVSYNFVYRIIVFIV